MQFMLAGVAAALLALGCVGAAQRGSSEARARYEQCVAQASAAQCAAERERMLAAERTYQDAAQRAWGCDPANGECPRKR